MNPTTILTAIQQALQEDTYTATLKNDTLTIHVPSTGKTHTITYEQETQEILLHPGNIGLLGLIDANDFIQSQTINIANPNLFHLIHQHLNNPHQTNKPAIPLPAGDRDKGQEADSYKHHPPRGNA